MTGYTAYRRVQNVSETPRAIERRLLGEVSAALIGAKDNPTDIPRLIDALLWNKQVWDHFMIDLNEEENKLPPELKKNLIGLGIWVNRETQRVMDGDTDCGALIEINQIIMDGLK